MKRIEDFIFYHFGVKWGLIIFVPLIGIPLGRLMLYLIGNLLELIFCR